MQEEIEQRDEEIKKLQQQLQRKESLWVQQQKNLNKQVCGRVVIFCVCNSDRLHSLNSNSAQLWQNGTN